VLAWPWTTELLLGGGLVLACLVIAAAAAASQVEASDPARLRTGE
jgi:acyl-CoA hydrolase